MPEIEKMLALSTAHLTKNVGSGRISIPSSCHFYPKGEYGYFVWVPNEYMEESLPDLPMCLVDCLRFAKEVGCSWIMFDRDADTVEGLPVYDW